MEPTEQAAVFIKAETLYKISVSTFVFAYLIFLFGWLQRNNILLPLLLCLPLIIMSAQVIGKRRRYYQFIPNILVLYIGWAIAEIFINKAMHVYAALALVAWLICLVCMLLLVRTNYLIDGNHYISTRKKKRVK